MRDSQQSLRGSEPSGGSGHHGRLGHAEPGGRLRSLLAVADGGPSSPATNRRCGPIPPKLYRIGEIVDYSGLSRQTIHNYTTMGLLRESQWTRGGHRLYDESVFERLNQVLMLKEQRKSMQEIREHFSRVDELQ